MVYIHVRPAITDHKGNGMLYYKGLTKAPEGATIMVIGRVRDWVLQKLR